MKMDLERIGGRHRDNSHHFAAESEALDQIAKEVNDHKISAQRKITLNIFPWKRIVFLVQNYGFTYFFSCVF